MRLRFVILAVVALGGCAFNSQQANIAPEVQVASSSIGSGIEIALTIKDERDDKSIGYRGNAYGNTAEITSEQNIEAVVYNTLSDAFSARGFSVVPPIQAGTENNLTVEIRLIEYNSTTNFFTFGIHTKVTFKAIASDGSEVIEQFYRAEKEEREIITPTATRNERYINETVSKALNELVNDDRLVGLFVRNKKSQVSAPIPPAAQDQAEAEVVVPAETQSDAEEESPAELSPVADESPPAN